MYNESSEGNMWTNWKIGEVYVLRSRALLMISSLGAGVGRGPPAHQTEGRDDGETDNN